MRVEIEVEHERGKKGGFTVMAGGRSRRQRRIHMDVGRGLRMGGMFTTQRRCCWCVF